MSRAQTMGPQGELARQIPAFALVGLAGFCVDSLVTYGLAHGLGVAPALARPPAVLVAMIGNFLLNRAFTFDAARTPLLSGFARYALVSALATLVNYAVYLAALALAPRLGIAVTPAMLPLFVAIGVAAAMAPSFVGFRAFAFKK